MEQTNNNNNTSKFVESDLRKSIRKKVLFLEQCKYNQKEFNTQELVKKIRSIIEKEVNANDNK